MIADLAGPDFFRLASILDDESQRVARVYSVALERAAESRGQADAVLDELNELVDGVFREQPDLGHFLGSPAVQTAVKEDAIRRALGGKASDLLLDFLLVLNRQGRLDRLRAIAFNYRILRDQKNRRARVFVRTAKPLTDDQQAQIRDMASRALGLEPVLEVTVDPDLLGGLVIRYRDRVFDGSVRTQLNNIRTQLLAGSSHAIQSGRDRFSHQ
jgi:F-type H+-transporting ATPase subunit delta